MCPLGFTLAHCGQGIKYLESSKLQSKFNLEMDLSTELMFLIDHRKAGNLEFEPSVRENSGIMGCYIVNDGATPLVGK